MSRRLRLYSALVVLVMAASQPAHALLIFNQGKDQVFVSASYGIGYDSNVFTNATARGSVTQNASLSIDYTRRAGVIGVNASVSTAIGIFENLPDQNFQNPDMSLSFNKGKGRLTGNLALHAKRENRADPDANQRSRSWNYTTSLNLRYPVNDRYFFTSSTDYSGKFYTNKALFTDLNTYAEGLNVNYVYTSKLNFQAGTRVRVSDTSRNTQARDYNATIGANGALLPKLNGSFNIGYQVRDSETVLGPHETFDAFSASMGLNWPYSRKLGFTGDVSKDFTTTSTNISTDTTSVGIHASSTLTRNFFLSCGITDVRTASLGTAGAGRIDNLLQFDANIGFAFTTKIRSNLSYVHQINTSNRSNGAFVRDSFGYSINARY